MEAMEKELAYAERLEKAAWRLGIAAILSTFLIPVVLPFALGSIAIVFAVLSKGRSRKMSRRGKLAVLLGCLAMGLNIAYVLYTAGTVYKMMSDPSGRQEISDLLYRMYGMTLDEFLSQTGFAQ